MSVQIVYKDDVVGRFVYIQSNSKKKIQVKPMKRKKDIRVLPNFNVLQNWS